MENQIWTNNDTAPTNDHFDVFLCHNSEDKDAVKAIARKLNERGLRPWLDEEQIIPGRSWQRELESQIQRINSVAVFVGTSGIGPWQDKEQEAFLREFAKRDCPVIPVILHNVEGKTELPPFLAGLMWIDFRKTDPDPLRQLIWGIRGEKPSLYFDEGIGKLHLDDDILEKCKDVFKRFRSNFRTVESELKEFQRRVPGTRSYKQYRTICEALLEKRLTISVFGDAKAGKSTLVNALLGRRLSPVDVDRATTVPLRIRHGKDDSCLIVLQDGQTKDIRCEQIGTWMRESSEEELEGVTEVVRTDSGPVLGYQGQIHLLDTAGLASRVERDQQRTNEQLEQSVAAILVYRYGDPIRSSYFETLNKLSSRRVLLFAVCNEDPNYRDAAKSSPDELMALMDKNEGELRDRGAECIRVDAKSALEGRQNTDSRRIRESGIEELEAKLRRSLHMRDFYALRERVVDVASLISGMDSQLKDEVQKLQPAIDAITRIVQEIDTERDRVTVLLTATQERVKALSTNVGGVAGGMGGAAVGGASGFVAAASIGAATVLPWVVIPALICAGIGALSGTANKQARENEIKSELEKVKTTIGASRLITSLSQINYGKVDVICRRLENLRDTVRNEAQKQTEKEWNRKEYHQYQECAAMRKKLETLRNVFRNLETEIVSFQTTPAAN